MKQVPIHTPYITLGQLLKLVDLVSSGGEAREFLFTHSILVDGVEENRRGKKLYPDTEICIDQETFRIVSL